MRALTIKKFPGIRLALALLLTIGSASLATPSFAQQSDQATGQQPESTGPEPGKPITRDDLLALIANEVVLAPGVGLRNIRIGEPLESVQARLGPPASVSRDGVFTRMTNLTYQLDAGTVVVLAGRDVIERIIVRGSPAALVRTVQGARFGMNPTLITRIYRNPTRVRSNRMEYRNLGITFYFGENGGQGLGDGVSRIELYPRG